MLKPQQYNAELVKSEELCRSCAWAIILDIKHRDIMHHKPHNGLSILESECCFTWTGLNSLKLFDPDAFPVNYLWMFKLLMVTVAPN